MKHQILETWRRYKRGLGPDDTPVQQRAWLKEKEETCVACSVVHAVTTVLVIPLLAAAYCWAVYKVNALSASPFLTAATMIVGYVPTIVAIARQQRAMENLVHDGSHGNWHRKSKKINNWLVDAIVAVPVLSSVATYWPFHRDHHRAYGGHEDPCRRRFDAMGLHNIDLSTSWNIAVAVLRWLPEYNAQYYKEIGSLDLSLLAKFAIWHLFVIIFPVAMLAAVLLDTSAIDALALGIAAWVVFWMLPFTLPLPVIRSIAEAEEHDYDRADNEADTTYSNTGLWHRLLFHPAGDAFHWVHHMHPQIPARVHHKVHRYLLANNERYRNSLHRTRVLKKP